MVKQIYKVQASIILSNYSPLTIVRGVCQNAQCHFPTNLHFNNIDILLKHVIFNC